MVSICVHNTYISDYNEYQFPMTYKNPNTHLIIQYEIFKKHDIIYFLINTCVCTVLVGKPCAFRRIVFFKFKNCSKKLQVSSWLFSEIASWWSDDCSKTGWKLNIWRIFEGNIQISLTSLHNILSMQQHNIYTHSFELVIFNVLNFRLDLCKVKFTLEMLWNSMTCSW